MRKKAKQLLGSLFVLIILLIAVLVYIEPAVLLNDFARNRNSMTLDIWILERSSMNVDLSGLEKRIVSVYGAEAIPKLDACVNKFKNSGDVEKAERCLSLIKWIKGSN